MPALMFAPRLVTPPATTPVSVADVKAHLQISGSADDTILTGFIAAVMGMIDGYGGYLGRCVVAQQWAQDYCGWPCDFRCATTRSTSASETKGPCTRLIRPPPIIYSMSP